MRSVNVDIYTTTPSGPVVLFQVGVSSSTLNNDKVSNIFLKNSPELNETYGLSSPLPVSKRSGKKAMFVLTCACFGFG